MHLCPRMISGCLYALFSMISYQAHGTEVAILAPVGGYTVEDCNECGDICDADISLNEVRNSYKDKERPAGCRPGGHLPPTLIRGLYSSTNRNVCGIPSPTALGYYWVPIDSLKDGTTARLQLLARAQDGKPFGQPRWPNSNQIIETDNSTPNEQHLALCEVHVLSNAVGPPINCGTVAIITPSQIWLRGTDIPPNTTTYGCV